MTSNLDLRKLFCTLNIRMLNLSLNKLKLIARIWHIKGYKIISKERLFSALNKAESVEIENNFGNARIRRIREDFNELKDRFLKPKIKEIRRNLYETESKKNLSKSNITKIEKSLFELEESLSMLKKYYDNDDIEYKGMREVENSFNMPTYEDYYKELRKN